MTERKTGTENQSSRFSSTENNPFFECADGGFDAADVDMRHPFNASFGVAATEQTFEAHIKDVMLKLGLDVETPLPRADTMAFSTEYGELPSHPQTLFIEHKRYSGPGDDARLHAYVPLSIDSITVASVNYTENRGRISSVVRQHHGFVKVENQKGAYFAISEASLNELKARGLRFCVEEELPTGNNLAMYQRISSAEHIDLPAPDFAAVKRGVRPARRQYVKDMSTSGNDNNVEHSG